MYPQAKACGFFMEIILLSIITLAVVVLCGFIFISSQKHNKALQDQLKEINQMQMAGSFQEWNRIKAGKRAVPNKIKEEENFTPLTEDNPIPFDEIEGVKINNEPRRKIKMYA